jgi:aldehyde reductase
MVKDAIEVGYRHIDTAYIYDNELEVGQAINEEIKAGKVNREDIFVTTKIWNTFHSKSKAYEAVKLALKKLNLKYIDLMLIHWPMGWESIQLYYLKFEK